MGGINKNHVTILERFGLKDLGKYKYVIGLDFGDGETSAAICDLSLNKFNINDIRNLIMDNNARQNIYTALYSYENNVFYVGNRALLKEPGNGYLFINFKGIPSRIDIPYNNKNIITKKTLVKKYIRQIINDLIKYNLNYEGLDRSIIFIGCPSSELWLREDVQYAKMLSDAIGYVNGHKIPVVIMPESRASLIKVLKEKEANKIGTVNASKGVATFDFGSSTADFTYINTCLDKPMEFSEPLGASYIETIILDSMFENSKYTRNKLLDYDLTKLHVRDKKENYFDAGNKHIAKMIIDFDDGCDKILAINEKLMNNAIKSYKLEYTTENGDCRGTWYSLCKGIFERAKTSIDKYPLQTIILTGGASKMPFIKKLCTEVFKNDHAFPHANIELDNTPSTCVSRGLTMAAFTDIRSTATIDKTIAAIKEHFASSDKEHIFLSELANSLAKPIFDSVVNPVLRKWSTYDVSKSNNFKDSRYKTLNKTCEIIQERFKRYITQNEAKEIIKKVLRKWVEDESQSITTIVNNCFKDLYGTQIPSTYQFEVTNKFVKKFTNELCNIKISLDINKAVNMAMGSLGLGFVLMDYEHDLDDRKKMYKRVETWKNMIIYGGNSFLNLVKCQGLYSLIYLSIRLENKDKLEKLKDAIAKELKPQVNTCVNRLALYFS